MRAQPRPPPAIRTSYHTHSRWCDGQGEAKEYVEAALAAGLRAVGLAGHSPTPYPELTYAVKASELREFVAERRRLQRRYSGRIAVWVGLELDYFPGQTRFYEQLITPTGLDYLIGSVHNLGCDSTGQPWGYENSRLGFERRLAEHYGGRVRRLAEEYYALVRDMVAERRVDVIGHLDRITKFGMVDQRSAWYRAEVERTLNAIAESGSLVELNTNHKMNHQAPWQPAPWVLRLALQRGIGVVVSSDAHRPDQVARGFTEAARLLRRLGCGEVRELTAQGWRSAALG